MSYRVGIPPRPVDADEVRKIVREEIERALRRPIYLYADGRIACPDLSRAARDPGEHNDSTPEGLPHARTRPPTAEP